MASRNRARARPAALSLANLQHGGVFLVFGLMDLAIPGERAWAIDAFRIGAIPVLVFLLYEFAVLIAALDELQRPIHITALAWGSGLTVTGWTFWAILAPVLNGPALDPVWALPVAISGYYGALLVVSRRFR